ncbi:MAG TPA: amino acid adenylation domain-containing protein, partial [Longimicrobium sp.]|nr:amino acid adenylation domain-containing protein [Longimicrobium sp.]
VMALCQGASLPVPSGADLLAGERLERTVAHGRITHVTLPPAVLPTLSATADLASVRTMVLAGEALPAAAVTRWAGGRRLLNAYGPTEAAVWTTAHECRADESGNPPIGRPIPNARVYILDAAGQPVPAAVAGELYIGGAGVARGYLGRPGLTAERFVADPFGGEPGARLYRTGDLGQWKADGTLEFAGRTDEQVKIRGFRIELGEIEARLAEQPGVNEAVVIAREDVPGDQRLVAYWTPAEGGVPVEGEALRSSLSAALPEYMVPAAYVRLEALPLTPTGKLDRRALPAPEGESYTRRGYEAPVGEVEEVLAGIWSEVLGIERVGRWDDFFKLGGHSLLAVQVIVRLRQRGLHAEVRALFTAPTLAGLAAEVGGESREAEVPANGIPVGCDAITPGMLPLVTLDQVEVDAIVATVPGGAANVQDIYPLAPLQEGILFHHLVAREGDPYLLAGLHSFESRAGLDRYLSALQAVVDRHDVLRTAVVWEGLREPVQVVWRKAPLEVEEVELDPARGDAAKELYARFDPRHYRIDVRRAPMMRACIARDEAGDRWLLLQLRHHLISDHTTGEVLGGEIEAHLSGRAEALPEPLPFRNYVAQARLGVSQEEHREFFTELLGDVEAPTAPFGLLDVRGDGSGIEEARLPVESRLAGRLRERARSLGVSAATVCHVAWAQVLSRVSGRDDVVFGTVLFGRMQGGEGADRVMGPFINTLPVRIHVGEVGAEASVRQTHALLARLLRHEHASLALAQRCSAVEAPAPLFTALLNYRHSGRKTRSDAAAARSAVGGMRWIHGEERTNYPLMLSVDDLGEGFWLTVQIRAQVEARRVCALMHTALEGLVEALEGAPERVVGSIDVLPASERARVVEEWNRTEAAYPGESCLHELFEAQVARTPTGTAVVFEGEELNYAELNARANRLAHHLRSLGVGPDARVGICAERSLELVAGLLAVLKAGGAYVPLDPGYPAERLAYMLADSAPSVVLAQKELRNRIDHAGVPVLELDVAAPTWADQPATNPERGALTPDHLAYVIYTSGSTGRPKGVGVHHRGVVNRLSWMKEIHGLGSHETVLQKTPYSFDVSVWELFWPLGAGARLVLARPEGHRDPAYLLDILRRERVTTVHFVPSLLAAFLVHLDVERSAVPELKRVMCSGEALPPELVARFGERLPGVELHNLYGPTEASVDVTFWRCPTDGSATRVSIGRPVPNTRIYLLDQGGEPVPVGVAGELYIGGVQVARGYLGRPELTAERFVADPFGGEPGARLYRTGDLGRWLPDGTIEYLGRIDFQVKVRGFRIELGEIEARLAEHAGVREAVVVAREDAPGERRLVAYLVGGEAVEVDALRAHVGATLPEYMVPAAYVRLEEWPLTPSGKLDRKALPAPEGDAYAAREYEAPEGETEQALAEIWAEVLRVERVGRWDHFFDLGGHSLLAVQMVSRLRQALGVELPLSAVFQHPVFATLADDILDLQLARFDPETLERLAGLIEDPVPGD